jgi:DNA replication and repair protein RecF
VPLKARRIFLVGENGQGKSNFLEAVYLLSYGSSFRTSRENELITHGKREMALNGRYARPEENYIEGSVAFKLGRVGGGASGYAATATPAPAKSGKEKTIELDGTRIYDRKQLISHLPAIVFSHDDIYFVNGPPERRRWFFNQTLSLFDPLFIDTLRDYRKILKMRNLALKDQRRDLIPIYDQQLAAAGLEIQRRRADLIGDFNRVVAPIFEKVSTISEPLSIEYRPSWPAGIDQVCRLLEEKREQDLLYGTTSSGPHRDRFIFRLAGTDFARIASTGQLRLMSLILRIGQCRYFSEKTGRRPILLLDDVLLELDSERRKRFLAQLPEYEQAFFTFLPDEKYLELAGTTGQGPSPHAPESPEHIEPTAVYWVENGWIQKMNETNTATNRAPPPSLKPPAPSPTGPNSAAAPPKPPKASAKSSKPTSTTPKSTAPTNTTASSPAGNNSPASTSPPTPAPATSATASSSSKPTTPAGSSSSK